MNRILKQIAIASAQIVVMSGGAVGGVVLSTASSAMSTARKIKHHQYGDAALTAVVAPVEAVVGGVIIADAAVTKFNQYLVERSCDQIQARINRAIASYERSSL